MNRARLGRFVHKTLGVGVAGLVFATVFTGSVVAHGDLPVTRRFAAEIGSWALKQPFEGRIVINKIDHLGWDGIDVDSADVLDPEGRRVIAARGIHGRFSMLSILHGVAELPTSGLSLVFDDVRVDDADVLLDGDDKGSVRIAEAFKLKPKPPEKGPPKPPTAPKPLFVALPRILVLHARAHGSPTPAVPIDASADNVAASVVVTEQGVSVDVERSKLSSVFLRPLDPAGEAEYHLRATSGHAMMWTDFKGRVGDVAVTAAAKLADGRLEGTLDAPEITPDELRSLLPGTPLLQKLSARVAVDGPLDAIHVTGQAAVGSGSARLDAMVNVGPQVSVVGSLRAREIDPRVFVPTAPDTLLGGDVEARMDVTNGKVALTVDGATHPFVVSGQSVPGSILRGRYEDGALRGSLEILEPGAPLVATFVLDAAGELSLDGEIRSQSLAAVPRLRGAVDGSLRVKVVGKVAASGLDVRLDGDLRGVGKGDNRLGSGTLHARVHGKLLSPVVEADLAGRSLRASGLDIEAARVRATGSLLSPHVAVKLTDARWSDLAIEADVGYLHGLDIDKLHGTFAKADVETRFKVGALDVTSRGVELRGIDVESGAGSVKGDLTLLEGGITGEVRGTVDLEKLSRTVPWLVASHGTGTFVAKMSTQGKSRSGTIEASVTDAELFYIPLRTSATATVQINDTAVVGSVLGHVAAQDGVELADLRVNAAGALPGPLLSRKSWDESSGAVKLEHLTIDLDHLSSHQLVEAARMTMPIPRAAGKLVVTADVERKSAHDLPDASIQVETNGLQIDTRDPVKETGKLWTGVDGLVSLSVAQMTPGDAKTSSLVKVDGGARLRDDTGPLASLTASTRTDVATLVGLLQHGLDQDDTGRALRARVAALPIVARAAWAARPLEAWPTVIRPTGVKGTLSAALDVSGTPLSPVGSLTVRADKITSTVPGVDPWPVSAAFSGRFTSGHAEVVGSIAHEQQEVAQIGVSAEISAIELARGTPLGQAWSVGGLVSLHDFPLHAVPYIAERGIVGTMSGTVRASGLHEHPRIDVDLALARAKVLDAPIDNGALKGWLSEGAGVLTLILSQSPSAGAKEGGKLKATAFPAVSFENGLRPRLDPTRAQTLAVQLSRFDVEPFSSFAAPVLADLRGYLDGEATLTLARPDHEGDRERANLWGKVTWSEGVLLIPQLGQTLTQGTFVVSAKTDGNETRLEMTDVGLKATTGRVHGSASFAFPTDAPALVFFGPRAGKGSPPELTGKANVRIDEAEKIPITLEGVPLGEAAGHADASILVDGKGVAIVVAIPDLQFDLPDTERAVQNLAPNPDVGVMDKQYRAGRMKRPVEATPIHVVLGIGAELPAGRGETPVPTRSVILRRAGLDVRLAGVPVVDFTDTMRVSGQIETLSGRVLALGKPFEVERGRVTFDTDDAANPDLALSARWDAPDGTRVYAELIGHFNEAKLRLRSDPPRSEAEVLSLVLFGRDPGQAGIQPGQADTQNVAAGTGVASTVLNSLLDPVQVFGRRIETRVDNTASRGTSIGVATEIRPNLWAQVDVSTARQQERQNADVSAVTLDWRFRKNWSLRTTVGDRGSTIFDLIWQYRY